MPAGVLYSIAYLIAGSYLRGNGQALLWLRILALLVPPLTGIFVIAQATPRLDGLPVAVLGNGRARSLDDGHRRRRMDGRRSVARARNVVGRVVHGLRSVRRSRSAAGASGAAAPWRPGTDDGQHRGRHGRYCGHDRLPVFPFCRWGRPGTAGGVSEASVPLLLLHEFQQFLACAAFTIAALGGAWPGVGGDIPTPGARADGRPGDPDDQQPGNPPGAVPVGRRLRSDLGSCRSRSLRGRPPPRPALHEAEEAATDEAATPSRPWVVFAALGALPLVDFALRKAIPLDAYGGISRPLDGHHHILGAAAAGGAAGRSKL